jgi:hypothetical protein
VRRNGGEQAEGGQAPGADERPPRHRCRQGDRREGRLRLPAQHLTQGMYPIPNIHLLFSGIFIRLSRGIDFA